MFQSKHYADAEGPFLHRERQLVAKYAWDHTNNMAWVVVELNGVEIEGSQIGFSDSDDMNLNIEDAVDYCAAFNKVWVMVEQTVEALHAIH